MAEKGYTSTILAVSELSFKSFFSTLATDNQSINYTIFEVDLLPSKVLKENNYLLIHL